MPKAARSAQFFSNQFGSAIIPIIIVVAVVVLVVVGAGGYFTFSKIKSVGNPLNSVVSKVASLNPNCEYKDPELCKYLNNFPNISQYAVKSTMSSKEGPSSESVVEIEGEGRMHMLTSEGGKDVWDVIYIDDITYTKDFTDNKWWKQQKAKTTDEFKNQFEITTDDHEEVEEDHSHTEYKAMGKEACGDHQCFKYEIIDPEMKGVKDYIWFDDKDYLLRRQVTESSDGKTESVYSYNNVKVSAPSPTKDASPDQIIMPGGGVMDTSNLKQMQNEAKQMEGDMQQYLQNLPSMPDATEYMDEDSHEDY